MRLSVLLFLVLPLAAGCASTQRSNALDSSAGGTIRVDSVAVGGSGMGGGAEGPYTLYSLATNRVVPNSDSASASWDLAFLGTTVRLNGGTSGPGSAAGRVVDAEFDALSAAPEAGLIADGEGDCPRGGPLAICTGSGNGWYTYSGAVAPLPGKTLVLRLADGSGYAKVRFVAYALSEPLADGSRPRYYTFDYARLP